ncbi:MAG: dihydrolipoyl dehydrogenase [Elusimicrobiaceae bacterium]|nr:dihydrolipoyl dehydrogenase [Elusimicrobiaceae bacterium]
MALKIAVIGGGPAGYPAAQTAARLGAEVTLIEQAQLGGVCLHCGCIPSKSLLDAAHRLDIARDISRFLEGDLTTLPAVSWKNIQKRQQTVTQKLATGVTALMKQAKVTVLQGTASFMDAHTLAVQTPEGAQTVAFDKAIIATGSQAFIPAPFDQLSGCLYDNSTIFQLPALPNKLVIVGGGAIGCEMATFMAALGVEVHLIEMQQRLLPAMDEGLARVATKSLQKRGVHILTGQAVTQARIEGKQAILTLSDGSTLTTPAVLAAIGRSCDLTALHPERAGLTWNRKGLQNVNPINLQVADHLYVAGDVTGLCLLAHAGTRQGIVAAQNACGQSAVYNNALIPNAVYTFPELACVGMSKAQAQAQGIAIKLHKSYLLANGRAQTMDETEGYVELISQADTGKLLGANLACAHASELLSALTVAVEAGLTISQLRQVVFPHPTLSEAIGEALAK